MSMRYRGRRRAQTVHRCHSTTPRILLLSMPKRRAPAHLAMGNWSAFWDSEHSIYVNARHRDVHYRMIADQIVSYFPSASTIILDYGCGEALHADRVGAAAARLILVEAAPSVRARLAARFGSVIRGSRCAPQASSRPCPSTRIDLIIMNSVIQY